MRTKAERLKELLEIDVGLVGGKCQANIVLDRAPGQQARLLKNHPETPGAGGTELSQEISVEAGCNPQNGRFAAPGRTDQRAERSGLEPKFQIPNHLDRRSIGRQEALRIDAKLKRGGVSSGSRVFQAAVPKGFRSQA